MGFTRLEAVKRDSKSQIVDEVEVAKLYHFVIYTI